ncbi:putative oxysterol-binding protein-related protein 10 [Sesbania bispinosa]|nr:putative oxysterol-binding protein-related protein 10 [Sesbania bispinosa]
MAARSAGGRKVMVARGSGPGCGEAIAANCHCNRGCLSGGGPAVDDGDQRRHGRKPRWLEVVVRGTAVIGLWRGKYCDCLIVNVNWTLW